jgi:Flp pilus assembly protein TadD
MRRAVVTVAIGEAYYGRGLAYQRLGEKAKAEQDFEKAKKLGYKAPGHGSG